MERLAKPPPEKMLRSPKNWLFEKNWASTGLVNSRNWNGGKSPEDHEGTKDKEDPISDRLVGDHDL